MSVEQIIANKGLIKGFLTPLYYEEHTGRAALFPDGFAKVQQGYACPRCLAEFAMCLVKCPLCSLVFDSAADLEDSPQDWVDNLKEHARIQKEAEAEEFDGKGNLLGPDGRPVQSLQAASPDDFIGRVKADKDIDQVPLSKLLPSKKGRK